MIPTPLPIFIGYDSREPTAYHVLAHSILRRASRPVSITGLSLPGLSGIYTRERGATEATEFSMTRFLVPFLCGYEGYAAFMDCDMLVQTDWCQLSTFLNVLPDDWAVACVQHEYVPRAAVKMDGQVQTTYPRKNWSSFMVFDNARCRALTPEYVNTASGLDLHRFNWLPQSSRILPLPLTLNWLVGEYEPNPDAAILHYTLGGPWFPETASCDHGDRWLAERDHMLSTLTPAQ